jgi:hypothetical protein
MVKTISVNNMDEITKFTLKVMISQLVELATLKAVSVESDKHNKKVKEVFNDLMNVIGEL